MLSYVALPVAAGIAGGIVAAVRPPNPGVTSAIQHLAAGVVYAAVAGEILPEMTQGHHTAAVAAGFGTGVALMLGLAAWERSAEREATAGALPVVALVALGVDLLIDGFLIGVGFAAGEEQGFLLTLALTLETLFLGLSVAALLARSRVGSMGIIGCTGSLSLLVAVGAAASLALTSSLEGAGLVAVFSFACAALLYLVTEELLVEAHDASPDSPWRTAMFFAGFLAVILLDLMELA